MFRFIQRVLDFFGAFLGMLFRALIAIFKLIRRYADFIVAFVVGSFYYLVWFPRGPTILYGTDLKNSVYTSVKEAIGIGITASSIFFPLTVVALSFLLEKSKSRSGIAHFLVSMGWFSASVVFGLWNLFRLPTMVLLDLNLAYEPTTAWLGAMQLCTLILGMVRFSIGTGKFVQGDAARASWPHA